MLGEILKFSHAEAFGQWLGENAATSDGVWLLFGKPGGPITLTATQALEEALCYGWIDGQMKCLDNTTYKKYFLRRTANSKWSDKNKKLAAVLEEQGRMTALGKEKIEQAKKNGQWDAHSSAGISEEHMVVLSELLKDFDPAYTNFLAMPPSVKKTYARACFDAKTQAGRERRLAWVVDRLQKNLRPM